MGHFIDTCIISGNVIPQRNVIYERALFNSRKQEPGEPVEEFITALHTLVEYCDYGDLRDQMVRDRIVVGLASNAKLSEKLQLDRKLTLDSAVTQARQDETVRKQQATLRGATKDSMQCLSSTQRKTPTQRKEDHYGQVSERLQGISSTHTVSMVRQITQTRSTALSSKRS